VTNNIIVDNISTHEGGGIGLNDAPNVRIYNNTIMKNMTTATARHQQRLPGPGRPVGPRPTAPTASHPDVRLATLQQPAAVQQHLLDNRAGTRGLGVVTGCRHWRSRRYLQLGPGRGRRYGFALANQLNLAMTTGTSASPTNSLQDPQVVTPYDISVSFAPWRNNLNFIGAIMVVENLPPNLLGDYHLAGGSPPSTSRGVQGNTFVPAAAGDP